MYSFLYDISCTGLLYLKMSLATWLAFQFPCSSTLIVTPWLSVLMALTNIPQSVPGISMQKDMQEHITKMLF